MKSFLLAAALAVAAATTVATFIAATPVVAEERGNGGGGRDSDPTAARPCDVRTHAENCSRVRRIERDHCGCPTSSRSNGIGLVEIRCPTVVAPGKVDCNNRRG